MNTKDKINELYQSHLNMVAIYITSDRDEAHEVSNDLERMCKEYIESDKYTDKEKIKYLERKIESDKQFLINHYNIKKLKSILDELYIQIGGSPEEGKKRMNEIMEKITNKDRTLQ